LRGYKGENGGEGEAGYRTDFEGVSHESKTPLRHDFLQVTIIPGPTKCATFPHIFCVTIILHICSPEF
jgi:hypothetical protein